jgi:hypothetical protein
VVIALVVALCGAMAAAVSVVVAVKLVPPRGIQKMSPGGQTLEDVEASTQQTREDLETLRSMVLQLRLELSESRRETADIRRERGSREDLRSRELEQRQRRERREILDHEDPPRTVRYKVPQTATS